MHELRTHPEADAELEETLRYLSENTLWQATRFADNHHAALLKSGTTRNLAILSIKLTDAAK